MANTSGIRRYSILLNLTEFIFTTGTGRLYSNDWVAGVPFDLNRTHSALARMNDMRRDITDIQMYTTFTEQTKRNCKFILWLYVIFYINQIAIKDNAAR